jgi:hypothetical protein
MSLNENVAVPCSVSQEFVEYVASFDEDTLMDNGKPILNRVLFLIGFDVRCPKEQEDKSKIGHKVVTLKDVLIRNPAEPSKVYATNIYNGQVRNEVDTVTDGIISYKKDTPHYMERVYTKNEILTIHNMTEEVMQCITTIGNKHWYDEGMKAMGKRIDPTKKTRNIVR